MNQHNFQKKIGKIMIILGWIVLLALLTSYFSKYLTNQKNPNQEPVLLQTTNYKEVRLQQNRYGHYVASGKINNYPVIFILDTGATHISIPQNIARKLNLKTGIPITVETANGNIEVYTTMLDSVSLGNIELQDISATINPYTNGNDILLGMSFLKYIDFSQQGDTLLIRQY